MQEYLPKFILLLTKGGISRSTPVWQCNGCADFMTYDLGGLDPMQATSQPVNNIVDNIFTLSYNGN